jgi:hypothetical protein
MPETTIPALIKVVVDSADFPTITGDSAYQTWLGLPGNAGKTEAEFIEDIRGPQGLPGSGGGSVPLFSSIAPGVTVAGSGGSSYASTGLEVTVTPESSAQGFLISCNGVSGNTASNTINLFTLFRKIGSGSFTDLTPSGGANSMAFTRTPDADSAHPFAIVFKDEPNTTDPVTYQLRWRSFNGTAHLGQRPDGTNMKANTTMKVERL